VGKGPYGQHSDPKVYGGDPKQTLTALAGDDHSVMHSALYAFMKTFGMNYRRGTPGRKILNTFGRDEVLKKLAAFYKGMVERLPNSRELREAADDFFRQHPDLR
jgi:hypothetical protein